MTLVADHVRVVRHASGREVVLLADISLELPAGTLLALIGPSGGGKTTFVRLLNRLEDPTSGELRFGGISLQEIDPLLLRRRVGFVPQVPFLFATTVRDNLTRPFLYRNLAVNEAQLAEALALSGLGSDFLPRAARELSVGQQQRVALARALVMRPDLLVVDEPTSALDRRSAEQVGLTLRRLCRESKLAVLLVTHDLTLAGRLADELVFMCAGRIVERGAPERLLNRPESEELRQFLASPESEEGRAGA